MSDPLVFSHTVESFFRRALAGRRPPALEDAVREVGIDLSKPLLPAYPFDVWLRALEVTAKTLYPGQPLEEAFFDMGCLLVTSYQETMIGRALFTALRVLSPRRVIDRMARNFRTSNNFTEVAIQPV